MNINNTHLDGYAEIEITLPDGEVITLDSYIDEHQVRRYVPNQVIDAALDDGLLDLNRISVLVQHKNIPIKDRVVFWAMLGYSVDGMCDLTNSVPMDKCKVVTPEWTSAPRFNNENEDNENIY